LSQTRKSDLGLFMKLRAEQQAADGEVHASVLIPAFMISELKTAFQIAFLIYVPFLILDLVVASVVMSMGMMFLPPVLISLPLKLAVFVVVDGWNLLVGSLVESFK
jgi:flagellar biosynthetic protein FliP